MGKGRAPCCEKGKVKRGPWSPAEDLKLITFIQKNGHDNWRSLPKQSGLVRCGKSCRLRWINYLRPDVKRGNFTKEEEENIIKLHETLGNKWSKIASHFPGRTDNEIKNVWNTHLKKKLAKIANNSANESKESSIITTSSSSSSTNSILSGRKRDSEEAVLEEEESEPKRSRRKSMCCVETLENNKEDVGDNDSTAKEGEANDGVFSIPPEESPKQQAVLSTTTSSNSFYGTNGSSTTTTTQIDHHASKLGDLEDEILMDGLLLDFEGPFDVDAILQEVNQPGQEVMPLLLEDNNDDSFWDMFGPNSITLDSTLFDPKSQEVQVLDNNDPHQNSFLNSILGEEKDGDIANNKEWFRYLESELGLEEPMVDKSGQKEQALAQNYHAMAIEEVGPECNFFDLEPKPEFSPSTYDLWPSN